MDKFIKLENYLKTKSEESFILSFDEIENILGFKLTDSAYLYPAYWHPGKDVYPFANMVMNCGYKMEAIVR